MNLKEKSKKKRKCNFLYNFVKITGAIPALLWLRPKRIFFGQSESIKFKGMIVCSNHNGYSDPILLQCVFWNRTVGSLAVKELFDSKLKNFFFSRMHCIPVDKENFSLDSLHLVRDELIRGSNVVIFPEGRINVEKNCDLLEFKSGAVLIAYLSNAPIVPIFLVPTEKWYQRKVAVVGEPINIRDICNEPSMTAMENAGEIIKEKILQLRDYYLKLKGCKNDKSKGKRV